MTTILSKLSFFHSLSFVNGNLFITPLNKINTLFNVQKNPIINMQMLTQGVHLGFKANSQMG